MKSLKRVKPKSTRARPRAGPVVGCCDPLPRYGITEYWHGPGACTVHTLHGDSGREGEVEGEGEGGWLRKGMR